jgi:Tfp pilus assembly protein PilN
MMVQINLLPKRYRKQDGRFKIGKAEMIAFSVAAVTVLAMVGLSFQQDRDISNLNTDIAEAQRRTVQLQQDIQLVDGLMDMKQKIAERMQAVEKLDRHRSSWVRILEDMNRRIPDFVWLSSFAEVDPIKSKSRVDKPAVEEANTTADGLPIRPIEIEGYSFTLNSLAAFMIKMMRSNFFDEIDLVYAKELQLDNKRAFSFKVQGRLHYLSDDELRTLLAAEKELRLLARK